ncbi:unnamed protein product, partial [Durusdinium trenchii]
EPSKVEDQDQQHAREGGEEETPAVTDECVEPDDCELEGDTERADHDEEMEPNERTES